MSGPDDLAGDVLRSPQAGALVIRGGAVRAAGFGVAAVLGAVTSVFLLRGLSVGDFGRFATVGALLGIVSTLSDAGLTAVGVRELSLRRTPRERSDLLASLVALRLWLASAAIAVAAAFAVLGGYDDVMVAGVLLGGLGVLLVNTQATMMAPLSVELRQGRITAIEVLRSAVTLVAVAALAIAGASLLPYFAVQILVGVVVLALTPWLLRSTAGLAPRVDRRRAWALLRIAAPVGIALAMNVIYLRLLVVLVSLQTDATETGLYGTAFRIVELFIVLPPMIVGIAIPLLAVAGAEDLGRLRYGLQGLTAIAVVSGLGLALVLAVLAEPALRLLGGGDKYVGATEMLQIQVFALVPLGVGHILGVGLLSLGRQRLIAWANAIAVVVVLTVGLVLTAAYGGRGAAVAAIVAEAALLLALAVFLARSERVVLPSASFVWRPLVAFGAGAATLLVPLPAWIDGAVAAAAFVAVAVAVRALPTEVLTALRRRAPGDLP
jgi:O-antigen/teichoic acid export membrane protein